MVRKLFTLSLAVASATVLAVAPGVHASSPSPAPASAKTAAPAQKAKTIVDVATEAGSFTTLLKALEAADLVKTLSEEGPFTVFAPTDEAFAALPKGTLDDLLKPENKEKLKRVLSYHVVSGELLSQNLEAGKVTTLAEVPVEISIKDGIRVNDAKVATPDLKASNGVIHVIDKVLLPPEK
ncbi:fasciclin domain-containing protein [Synechococcus sp. O70.1]|uniref:fasciclin domain-containing protein n=1 Tax=Synechococcus sp. O70.1 TaxID=2964535 RepID=UPI0039C2CB73